RTADRRRRQEQWTQGPERHEYVIGYDAQIAPHLTDQLEECRTLEQAKHASDYDHERPLGRDTLDLAAERPVAAIEVVEHLVDELEGLGVGAALQELVHLSLAQDLVEHSLAT